MKFEGAVTEESGAGGRSKLLWKSPQSIEVGHPQALLLILLCSALGGVAIGALTNAVSGALSPGYFVSVMGWVNIENVWAASIAQGMFEGVLYGTLVGLIMAAVMVFVTKGRCTFGYAAQYLVWIGVGTLMFWVLGGFVAIGLSLVSSEMYMNMFGGYSMEPGELTRYAFVGGSIWGAMIGAGASTLCMLGLFIADWTAYRRGGGKIDL